MSTNDEWTVVGANKKGSKRGKALSLKASQQLICDSGGWAPTEGSFSNTYIEAPLDPAKVKATNAKIASSQELLRHSPIYRVLSDLLTRHGCTSENIQTYQQGIAEEQGTAEEQRTAEEQGTAEEPPERLEQDPWQWASRGVCEMVMYGLGSPVCSTVACSQLALMNLLMTDHGMSSLAKAGRAWTYDPVMDPSDREVLRDAGWQILETNENGARTVPNNGPAVLFYMPHCEASLYDNLLKANWTRERLPFLGILGNSFKMYVDRWAFEPEGKIDRPLFVLAAAKFAEEVSLGTTSDHCLHGFNDMSFHTFSAHSLPAENDVFWSIDEYVIGKKEPTSFTHHSKSGKDKKSQR